MAVVTSFPPEVTPEMLRAAFWLARVPDADRVWLAPDAIADFNARVPDATGIPAVLALPDTLHADDVRARIAEYERPGATRYGWNGQPLDDAYFDALIANATPDLPEQVVVRFGLTVCRADLRSFPSGDPVTSRPYDFAFDRIQETAVDVGAPTAVVATSRDGRWFFALTPQYWGWLRVESVAFAPREQVAAFVDAQPVLVTTASRGLVAHVGGHITPQMGTRLPLLDASAQAWRVRVPLRTPAGTLQAVEGWANAEAGQFSRGALPLTLHTVLEQAFKLLGEVYAWGGTRLGIFGRDCSRLVQDVYASAGIRLPRNGDQQADACREVVAFTPDLTPDARTAALVEHVPPGALLYLPGHIMLYLGALDGVPYVIHDTSSSGYNGVIVSDLSLGHNGPSGSLLQRLTQAVVVA